MVREIVHIDEEKCDGCGLCIPSCHEGAIQLIDGKARLIDDKFCDGLGACLGHCPQDAITVERREADAFDEEAVTAQGGVTVAAHAGMHVHAGARAHAGMHVHGPQSGSPPMFEACPMPRSSQPHAQGCPGSRAVAFDRAEAPATGASALSQWPVQMHLISPMAPYFRGQDLLLCADCVAYAAGGFHGQLLDGKKLAIACPKLDAGQEVYLEKLVALIDFAEISSLTVARMEVPCCGGLSALAMRAAGKAERSIPIRELVIGIQGDILGEREIGG